MINVLRSYEGDKDASFALEIQRKGLEKYKWCIVMPAADRNLQNIVSAERIAGRDWRQIKLISSQIAEALGHMHRKGFIHGDVKPLNVMRHDGRMKLVDLDACASLINGVSGLKFSSAYIPPELIHYNAEEHSIMVKVCEFDAETGHLITEGTDYKLVWAKVSHDVWSLGMVMYELCAGIKFFLQDDEDNIDDDSMLELYRFKNDYKQKKLSKITDMTARNLVSQMLTKDPTKRPTIDQILDHPFLSGKKVSRMVGEEAAFDVFISYRVKADLQIAVDLYNALTQQGVKVWLDRECLSPGVAWEVGFVDGLLSSRVFMPIVSRDAINHPSDASQRISSLSEESDCDNLLMEWRLALELHTRGLIDKVYPLFVGTKMQEDDGTVTVSNYFRDNCQPVFDRSVIVSSIEDHVISHLSRLGLGSPMLEPMGVPEILAAVASKQGCVVDAELVHLIPHIYSDVRQMMSL